MPSRADTAHFFTPAARRLRLEPAAARVVRVRVVPALVLLALVGIVLSVLRAGGAAPPSAYAEFVDRAGTSYVDVQLNPAATSYGAFAAVLPGEGRVWPTERVTVEQGPGGMLTLQYDGEGERDPRVQPGQRYMPKKTDPEPVTIGLRLSGQVDPAGERAEVDIWVDGARHRISADGRPGGDQAALQQLLRALSTQDFDALYTLSSSSMRNGSTRADYVPALRNAGVINDITAARATAPTTRTVRYGSEYARTPVRLTYGSGADARDLDATLVLVLADGTWSLLTVE